MNNKLKRRRWISSFVRCCLCAPRKECYAFFEDICTVSELLLSRRGLQVARMLSEEARYQDICDRTGASSATISRVNRALHYGEDGYALVLERLKNESEDGSTNTRDIHG